MRRREMLGVLAVPLVFARSSLSALAAPQAAPAAVQRKGRLKQGVTQGVFARGMSFEDTCREAARLGIKGYDLRGPSDWPMLKKYNLVPSMYQPAGPDAASIPNALNRKENHERMDRSVAPSMNRRQPAFPMSLRFPEIEALELRTRTARTTASRFSTTSKVTPR